MWARFVPGPCITPRLDLSLVLFFTLRLFFLFGSFFFFSTWKSKLKNPNHPEVNRRRITSQHFHRVIIVSHSFRCQKHKLFLIDGEKLWSIAEAWALSKLRLKKYLYCYAGTYFCFLYDHRTSEETTSELRRRCNAFFMELVSIFCFGDSVSKDLEKEATALLMRYVIGHQSTQTKDFSPFPDYAIDPTPVVRSFLLQQLLRSRWKYWESISFSTMTLTLSCAS